ncbi:MAG TPA: OmpA family protein [Lutibacter sp.]|nr:OmpA family protein [Lutibacter sp.]
MVCVELMNEKKLVDENDKNRRIKEIEFDKEYVFQNVIFDFNSVELKKDAKDEINTIYEFLSTKKKTIITIMGHADNVGNDNFNNTLSKNRAKSVKEYLINKGLNKNRISSIGYGNLKPIDSNDTEKGRVKNRRVEFVITKYDE